MIFDNAAKQFIARGVTVLEQFLKPTELAALRRICDSVLEQKITADPETANARNIAYLTERQYFRGRDGDLLSLLEFVANPRIVTLLTAVAGELPLFHNTQYFYHPASRSHDGEWHRDTQFLAPDPTLEQERMRGYTGVHFRVALLDDDRLEYVPGSEQRWDLPDELTIRKGPQPTAADMPGAVRITLKAGDACLFHAWGIHRGTYRADQPRRTLDIIYGWGGSCDYSPPPPMCFQDEALLARLSPEAQRFYRHFVKTYRSYWKNA